MKNSVVFIIMCILVAGCTSGSLRGATTEKNFVSRTTVTRSNLEFYSPVEKDVFKDCFLGDSKLQSLGCNIEFTHDRKLDMEQYDISIKDEDAMFFGRKIDELALLVAAQVALDNNYEFFTKVDERSNGGCLSNPKVTTYGSIYDDSYSGTSYVSQDTYCAGLHNIKIIAFNNPATLKNGVISGNGTSNKSKRDFNLYFDESDRDTAEKIKYFLHHPVKPWRKYLPAKNTYEAITAKYKIPVPLSFSIQNETSYQREDGIEQNLSIHQ